MLNKAIALCFVLGLASAYHQNGKNFDKIHKNETRAKDGSFGIFDGKNTTIEKHPFLVGILKKGEFACAGAILSEQWVLVLGGCVYGVTKNKLKVVVGSSDGTSGTTYSVKKIVQHPVFDHDSFDYDFALLKVKGSFCWGDSVGNVSLPSQEPETDASLTVVGYGSSSAVTEESGSSGTLKQGTMKWLASSTCDSYYEDYGIVFTDRMGCAYNKNKTTLCSLKSERVVFPGDLGDPFVSDSVLYGVFAGGASDNYCTASARPVIVTNLYSVVDWVNEYIGLSG